MVGGKKPKEQYTAETICSLCGLHSLKYLPSCPLRTLSVCFKWLYFLHGGHFTIFLPSILSSSQHHFLFCNILIIIWWFSVFLFYAECKVVIFFSFLYYTVMLFSFFFFKLIYFIFGCVGSSLLCAGFLYLWQAGATLRCGTWASHCGGFSCCRAQALGTWASVVVVQRLSSCGLWAQ